MKSEDVCLLVDNSNTRTKFALSGRGENAEMRMFPTADITEEAVQGLLAGWRFSRVCLCSVVPWAAERISQALGAFPVSVLTPQLASAIDFSGYPGIATLGADRVANVLAALEYVQPPFVAVDLGTASTFDIVVPGEQRPRFIGGMIAPGFQGMAASLHATTAQLPSIEPAGECSAIGRNTQEAMAAAMRIGYPAMVDALLAAIEAELGEKISVVLTGGDAAWVASGMRKECVIAPSLTLQGIAFADGLTL